MDYTPHEMMIVATAREIQDGEVLFVGMRDPLRAFTLAKQLYASHTVGLFECGVVRESIAPSSFVTMSDPPNILQASWTGGLVEVMGLLAQGHIHTGIIGGAQVDRYGNLNSSYIGHYTNPQARLPGSGGASDIASFAQRLLIMMPHERRRFVETVDYITSPGHGTGTGWREGAGLPARRGRLAYGGPDRVISTLALFHFNEEGEMVLKQLHPGVTVEEVQANTSWTLQVADDLIESEPPSQQEWELLQGMRRTMDL